METWRRFWNLSAPSRRLVVEAAVALMATWIGLRVVGYGRWKRVLEWFMPATVKRVNAADPVMLDSARAIARFQESAARHLFVRTNCLEQSLVLCRLLQRRGIAAEVRIGARKEEGHFEAHAWVELEGTVLNDALEQHQHFAPFDRPVRSMETQTP
jgi:hypothetical protein